MQLVETGAGSLTRSIDVMEISRPRDFRAIANLALTLPEAKRVPGRVQQAIAAGCDPVRQTRGAAAPVPCPGCGRCAAGIDWPAHSCSTPELDQLPAHLSALMTYRVAAGVLADLLPVAAGTSHEILRGHTFKIGERLAMLQWPRRLRQLWR